MNIIEELYLGNLTPVEKCFLPGSEYARTVTALCNCERQLTEWISKQERAEGPLQFLSELTEAQRTLDDYHQQERFIEGFRLGARLMLDTFLIPEQSALRDIR